MDDSKSMELACNVLVGLITGSIAILGIHLTNKHNHKVMREQRLHEARIAERERKITYKKEVYFEAANDMSRLIGLVQRLSDNNYPDAEFSASVATATAGLNKVNLIAGEATISKCCEGTRLLVAATCDITKIRLILKLLQSKIDAADKEFWGVHNKIQERHDEIVKIQADPINMKTTADLIEKNNELMRQQNKFVDDAAALREEWTTHLWSLSQVCVEHVMALNQCLNEIIIAMRNEIDFTISSEKFKELTEGSIKNIVQQQATMLTQVKEIVETMSKRDY